VRERNGERVLDRFFGEPDVAEKTDQNGDRTAMLTPENRFDLRAQ